MNVAYMAGKLVSNWLSDWERDKTWTVFTGADLRAIATPTYQEDEIVVPYPVLLNTLTGISISTHRDVFPVRALGFSNPRGWSYGNRTIAGTLIFAQLGEYGLRELINTASTQIGAVDTSGYPGAYGSVPTIVSVDEIPPLDLVLTFVNEKGDAAVMEIKGVKMLDEGESFTIDNQEWYTTVSYMAMTKSPMVPLEWGKGPSYFENALTSALKKSGTINKYDSANE